VRTYKLLNNTWIQFGEDIYGNAKEGLGVSVAMSSSGNHIVIGGFIYGGTVKLYYLKEEEDKLIQKGSSIKGNNDEAIGSPVAISGSGSRILVGSYMRTTMGGFVDTYDLVDNKLKKFGQRLSGDWRYAYFYINAMTKSSNRIIVGASSTQISGEGLFQVFGMNSTQNGWEQIGSTVYGETLTDRFGSSVDISDDGNVVIVGAPYGGDEYSGYVEAYKYNGTDWNQFGETLYGEADKHYLGQFVAISGNGKKICVNGGDGGSRSFVKTFDDKSSYFQITSGPTSMYKPTSIFDGQNFSVGKPQILFVDEKGDFSIQLNFTADVGHSIQKLNLSLKYGNCSTPYAG